MPLSIIIVNYNSLTDILNCINSACKFPSSNTFEFIIVDNQSDEKAQATITKLFPFVKWIDMKYNAGFARANNEGIRHSKGDAVLLLNPDTLILNDAIGECYSRFKNSDFVACAVQLLNPDHTPQITGNYFMKGALNQLLPLPYLGSFLRSVAFAFKVKKTNVQQASTIEKVDWINGAFLMVKRSAIEKAGMMDEDFFLYAEETEWCSRLKKVGDLVVYGDLHVVHLQGESINKTTGSLEKGYSNLFDKKGFQLMVSQHVRVRKQYGKTWLLVHLFIDLIEIPVFFLCSFFENLFHLKNPFKDFRRAAGYTVNVFNLYRLAPKMLPGKKHFYKVL